MSYPGAIIFPAHKTNTLGPPCVPRGFVLHTPEEPADGYPGTPNWFAQPHPDRPGSTTWFIATNGDVYECVAEDIAPIANGVIGKPYPAWADPNVSLNRQTHSVEVEGYAATIASTLTDAQRTSLVSLIRYDAAKYGYPIDRQHIIGHYQVANNRSDPGTLNIDAIVAEAQEADMALSPEDRALLQDTNNRVSDIYAKMYNVWGLDNGAVEFVRVLKDIQARVTALELAAGTGPRTVKLEGTLE